MTKSGGLKGRLDTQRGTAPRRDLGGSLPQLGRVCTCMYNCNGAIQINNPTNKAEEHRFLCCLAGSALICEIDVIFARRSITQLPKKRRRGTEHMYSEHLHTFRVSLGGSTERKVPMRNVASTRGVKAAEPQVEDAVGVTRRKRNSRRRPDEKCKLAHFLQSNDTMKTPKLTRQDDDPSIQSTRHSIGNILYEARVVFSSDDGFTKIPQQ